MDYIQQLVTWLRRRWAKAGPIWGVLLAFVGASAVAGLLWLLPFVRNFGEFFRQAKPEVQGFVLWMTLVAAVGTAIYAIERAIRVEELKGDRDQLDVRLMDAEENARQLQERWDHLLDVECRDILWKRPCAKPPVDFVPRLARKTRFLTILNLKGGVGKTTLTGNLAASLASHESPLRVLVVDIDFQGTLGDSTADVEAIRLQHQNQSLINLLLTSVPGDPHLIEKLVVPMKGVEKGRVILANDSLDAIEFQLQARFFLDSHEDPRFRFRSHLLQSEVFDRYDLVIFDCPPRVTTSVVNAIACSDYILIPTKLDDGSIDAVPRTLAWLMSLGALCQAEGIGVLASHAAVRVGKMVKADQDSYEQLRGKIESTYGPGAVFEAFVPASNLALPPDRGTVASTSDAGRKLYAPVVAELRRRMKI